LCVFVIDFNLHRTLSSIRISYIFSNFSSCSSYFYTRQLISLAISVSSSSSSSFSNNQQMKRDLNSEVIHSQEDLTVQYTPNGHLI